MPKPKPMRLLKDLDRLDPATHAGHQFRRIRPSDPTSSRESRNWRCDRCDIAGSTWLQNPQVWTCDVEIARAVMNS